MKLLRIAAVVDRTGISRSLIYQRIKEGRFPQPVPLDSPRLIGWVESEIDAYNATLAAKRAARPSPVESAPTDT